MRKHGNLSKMKLKNFLLLKIDSIKLCRKTLVADNLVFAHPIIDQIVIEGLSIDFPLAFPKWRLTIVLLANSLATNLHIIYSWLQQAEKHSGCDDIPTRRKKNPISITFADQIQSPGCIYYNEHA